MPEGTGGFGGLAGLCRVQIGGDDRNLRRVRVVILGKCMRHQRSETPADVQQPVMVFVKIAVARGVDGRLDRREVVVPERAARIDAEDLGAERPVQVPNLQG